MYIDVDLMTDEEVRELQQEQWDDKEFVAKKDRASRTMIELCENMRSMSIPSYRNYLKKTNEAWDNVIQ